ncbi:MAG: hypothetical protein E6G67_02640 [Actinobacteria bacterium]|nr:MAG: hypothetical protein E6G67_02640 [Actinomycetota bacterium]
MRGRINPTLRGFVLILVIAGVITALSLQPALWLILLIIQALFLVAIAYAVYRAWRNRRGEIALWGTRAKVVFYGAALVALVDVVAAFLPSWPVGGFEDLVFFCVLGICGFAMWRVWHDEHTYGY